MRAPSFWSNPPERPGWQAALLAPAAWAWRIASERRTAATTPGRVAVPVICIGNLTAGGSGKTPTVAWLVEQLQGQGRTPHVLSRGYGGTVSGPHRVDLARDDFREVGDEPLLLAALAPVWIATDRAAGARAAVEAGADVIVMDDGLQNPSLDKDVSLVVVDAGQGFGNGRLIPAGPLREPVASGLERADAVLVIGPEAARSRLLSRWPSLAGREPQFAKLAPRRTGLDLSGERVVAFAGIGRPEKFFETLEEMGAEIVQRAAFADHYVYPEAILNRLAREARAQNAMLVTTEKDAVRLPIQFRREVMTVQVALEPDDPARFLSAITERLDHRP